MNTQTAGIILCSIGIIICAWSIWFYVRNRDKEDEDD